MLKVIILTLCASLALANVQQQALRGQPPQKPVVAEAPVADAVVAEEVVHPAGLTGFDSADEDAATDTTTDAAAQDDEDDEDDEDDDDDDVMDVTRPFNDGRNEAPDEAPLWSPLHHHHSAGTNPPVVAEAPVVDAVAGAVVAEEVTTKDEASVVNPAAATDAAAQDDDDDDVLLQEGTEKQTKYRKVRCKKIEEQSNEDGTIKRTYCYHKVGRRKRWRTCKYIWTTKAKKRNGEYREYWTCKVTQN